MIKNKKRLLEILSKFNTSNDIFKYSTHSWDFAEGETDFNTLDEFLVELRKEFDTFEEELKELSPHLHNKIKTFFFNKENKAWGINDIEYGWSSPTLKNYENKTYVTVPYQYVLENEYRQVIEGYSMDRFGDVANNFKNEIEFRSEKKAIKFAFRKHLKKHWIGVKFINLDNFDQYEDIETFHLLLENIIDIYGKNDVEKVVIENKEKVITIKPITDKKLFYDIPDYNVIADYSVDGNNVIISYKR